MKKKIIIFSMLAFFALCYNAEAQEDQEDDAVEGEFKIVTEVKETAVLYHKVSMGETVMMISKKYMVNPQDIYEINPDAVDGLKPDKILKIPADKIKAKLDPGQIDTIRTEQIAISKKYD